MTWKSTIQAVHTKFRTFDTSSVQSNFTNFYTPSLRTYTAVRSFDTGSAQSNFMPSSYVYLPYNPVYVPIHEGILITDIVQTSPVPSQETSVLFDQVFIYPVVNPIFGVKLVINGLPQRVFSVRLVIGTTLAQTFSTRLNIGSYVANPITSIP